MILNFPHGLKMRVDENNDTNDVPDEGSVRLVGFQQGDVQRLALIVDDARKEPEKAIGLCPVFSRGEAGIFAYVLPVTAVDL